MRRVISTLVVACAAPVAWAQPFDFRALQPTSADRSQALETHAGEQVGWVHPIGSLADTPAMWRGSSQSYEDLLPKGGFWEQGEARGTWGGRQVGWMSSFTGISHSALWSGSAESFVDLHPSGYRNSAANAIVGSSVVGVVDTASNFDDQAGLWNLDTGQFTYLHPPNARLSFAVATDGVSQGGSYSLRSGHGAACMWRGTRESFIDLHPDGARGSSVQGVGTDASGHSIQVGIAQFVGTTHAAHWTGSAESFVSLHPAGALASEIRATTGTIHVGSYIPRQLAAWNPIVWFGHDPTNFIDLRPYMPAGWGNAAALGVSLDGDVLTIVGSGASPDLGRVQAWMMTTTIPAPGPAACGLLAMAWAARRRRG